jgi:hypothetical protein
MSYDALYRIIILFGINYFLVIVGITLIIYQKNRKFFVWGIITSVAAYLLFVIPFLDNYIVYLVAEIPKTFADKWIFGGISLIIIILTQIKHRYFLKQKLVMSASTIIIYTLYFFGLINLELNLILNTILLFACVIFIIYMINNEHIARREALENRR